MKRELILIGGGGHCKSCIEVIESTDSFIIRGVLDPLKEKGAKVCGYDILGSDEDIPFFVNERMLFLITIGQIKNAAARIKIAERIANIGGELATVISPFAIRSKRSIFEKGTILMHGAKVNADVVIGANAIINTNANIEHDCKIGNFVHVSTGVNINGNCTIEDEVFIGSGSILVQGVSVCSKVVIGAGTLVNRVIATSGMYIGNPCRQIN